MYFEINNDVLLDSLKVLNRVVPTRSTLPILSSVLFSSDGEKLTLRASDLEVSLEASLPAKIKETFNIAVPISKILNICSSLKNETLTFDINNNKIQIKSDYGEYNIMGQSSEEFPETVFVNQNKSITFKSKELSNLIDYTIASVCTDELKPSLQGVLFDINEAKTTLVSTDGHRLSKIESDQNSGVSKKIIIPTKFLKILQPFLLLEDSIEMLVGENHIQVFFKRTKIATRIINDTFPDYEKVIPKNNDKEIIIQTKTFINSLKRISVFSNQKTKQATLTIKNNNINLCAEDAETAASAKEKIECVSTNISEEISIAFNGDYLKEILEKTTSEETVLLIKDPLSAALIFPKEKTEKNEISLLMPIRLQ